MLVLLYQELDS